MTKKLENLKNAIAAYQTTTDRMNEVMFTDDDRLWDECDAADNAARANLEVALCDYAGGALSMIDCRKLVAFKFDKVAALASRIA